MKRNSPLRSNQLRRTSSDSGPSVRPKKWADLDHQQSSVHTSSEQDSSKSPKPSKTPNRLAKPVSNTKKPIARQSPYSYCAKKVYLHKLIGHIFPYYSCTLLFLIATTISNSCQKMHFCNTDRRKDCLARVGGIEADGKSQHSPREA